MHLVVCAKQIPDPETPPAAFRIDAGTNAVVPAAGIKPVLSPFDAQAAEAALRIRELAGEGKITVISLVAAGSRSSVALISFLKKTLKTKTLATIITNRTNAKS